MLAAYSGIDPEGKVRLLLDHGADRDLTDSAFPYEESDYHSKTALQYAHGKPAVRDLLENYRPDVSR